MEEEVGADPESRSEEDKLRESSSNMPEPQKTGKKPPPPPSQERVVQSEPA